MTQSCAERLSGPLGAVRKAMMDLDNAMETDASYESWEAAIWAAGELRTTAETLYEKVAAESRKAEADA